MASSSGRAWSYAAVVAATVVAADQLTKHLIVRSLADGDHRDVIPGLLQLVHATNNGVAFSVSAGGPALVLVVIGLAVAAIVGYFATHHDRPLIWLPTGLILGGAIGNLADRVRTGAVTDFIKLPHWPAFNVADTSITLGVVALLVVLRDDGTPSTS